MKDQAKRQEQPISSTQQACLVAFHDAAYTQAEQEAQSSMFEMVSPLDLREGYDAIIIIAQKALLDGGCPEAEQIAVSLLMLLEVKQLSFDQLAKAFGEDIANVVETSRAIGEPGNGEDWNASLDKFARMPPNCQTLRMALLLGLVELSSESCSPHEFWYEEALALPDAHPSLRQQVIARLEETLIG
ncbi:hypothetical protein HVA01_06810 [Halovibrio variabilis]|uniref:Uncharacterized protein n=1 Tax=Halovibrio variabilis TaxID=31910 RepID=A0A511UKB5_9GAMM|nr:hypothetical protein [Halovibrio variabilis]GEN27035.1 hypothetical protein HVA01_06810 [Halovibrio variabilis]